MTLTSKVDFQKRKKFITEGLYVDALRGWDSTGIAYKGLKDDDKTWVFKKAIEAGDFLRSRRANAILQDLDDYRFVIGHNRWATVGKVNDDTAHPYQHGDITLAHNGTLKFNSGITELFDTDSEDICYNIAFEGGAAEVLPKLNGAYALVWHDAGKNTINFARNKEREFHYAIADDFKSVYWASEKKLLDYVLWRADIKHQGCAELPVGKWFEWVLEGDFSECFQHDFKVKEEPVKKSQNYGHGYGNYDTYDWDTEEDIKTELQIDKGHYVLFRVNKNDQEIKTALSRVDPTCSVVGSTCFSLKDELKDVVVRARQWNMKRADLEKAVKTGQVWFLGRVKDLYLVRTGYTGSTDGQRTFSVSVDESFIVGTDADMKAGHLDWCNPMADMDQPYDVEDDIPFGESDGNVSEIETYIGPSGAYWSASALEQYLAGGCHFCSDALYVEEAEDITWIHSQQINDEVPVCKKCNDSIVQKRSIK